MLEPGSSPLTRGKPSARLNQLRDTRLIPAHAGKTATIARLRAGSRAHPRSRGENHEVGPPPPVCLGSSPLTRGKQGRGPRGRGGSGLIPAHAGKTSSSGRWPHKERAHPRSRGENLLIPAESLRKLGSSPLTRGKRHKSVTVMHKLGLIPAHAGKTGRVLIARNQLRAHPRSRGENAAEETAVDIHLGSSPLTRGKLGSKSRLPYAGGLIPAHAGKTPDRRDGHGGRRAHPRSRGENRGAGGGDKVGAGSSPLTRGKLVSRTQVGDVVGLIPAHAGKTPRPRDARKSCTAHPRSRGENSDASGQRGLVGGSSPLTRGKLARADHRDIRRGLIPAHAGKTSVGHEVRRDDRAHPRSRGENCRADNAPALINGSSPLTRGKPAARADPAPSSGLIPAHAGKTRRGSRAGSRQGAHPRSRGENPILKD